MDDQAKRLRNRLNRPIMKAKTIAIVSGKGGVGKSNTALNFALELQNRGKSVLLIDLDVGMGNIDILLGNDAKYSIAHLFNDFTALHDIIELGPYNLSYIAGGSSLNELMQLDDVKLNYFFDQYEKAVNEYDYILLDLGAGVDTNSMSFILASDECIVITTPEPTSITDAYSMIKHILLRRSNIPIYVIMNRCDRTQNGEKMLEKFKQIIYQFLKTDIIKMGLLPNDPNDQETVNQQTPYIVYDGKAPVSKALKEIVTNYLKCSHELNEIKPLSFIQRLKRLLVTR